jgi:hypothetical protein
MPKTKLVVAPKHIINFSRLLATGFAWLGSIVDSHIPAAGSRTMSLSRLVFLEDYLPQVPRLLFYRDSQAIFALDRFFTGSFSTELFS